MVQERDGIVIECPFQLKPQENFRLIAYLEDLAGNTASVTIDQSANRLNQSSPELTISRNGSRLPTGDSESTTNKISLNSSVPNRIPSRLVADDNVIRRPALRLDRAEAPPMIVNTRSGKFELDYSIAEGHAPEKVELWGSRDLGQSWEYWGDDPDRKSPCQVHVPEDGSYSFAIVPISGALGQSSRPVAGTAPGLTVIVSSSTQ